MIECARRPLAWRALTGGIMCRGKSVIVAGLAIIALLGAALAMPTQAQAVQSRTVIDPPGDISIGAAAADRATYRAASDITQVTYSRDATNFYVKVRTRNVLDPVSTGLEQEVGIQGTAGRTFFSLNAAVGGAASVNSQACAPSVAQRSWSLAEDWIVVQAPIRCLPSGQYASNLWTYIRTLKRGVNGEYRFSASDRTKEVVFRIR
jgi:hypothetical protein